MSKKQILNLLLEFRNIYRSLNDTYRERAYQNAYYSILKIDKIPKTKKELSDIKNIGSGIANKIHEYIKTGDVKKLKTLKKQQKYILNLTSVLGIGPSLAKKLIKKNIYNVSVLKKEFNKGNVKLTNAQQLGLKYYKELQERILRKDIDNFKDKIKKKTKILFKMMGSYRRGSKTSGDIDILIYDKKNVNRLNEFVEIISDNYELIGKLSKGKNKFSGLFRINNKIRHIDVLYVPIESLYTAINYFTGSKEHNLRLREFAKQKGYKVSEYSLTKNGKVIPVKSEKDLFDIIGMKYILPKNR
jgi:DNA polymerase/3'-5' exonuclease PolX